MPAVEEMSIATLLRITFTDFHNNQEYGADNGSAFLGENSSVQDFCDSSFHGAMSRNYSTEAATMLLAVEPCLIRMPQFNPATEDLGNSLAEIKINSWMMPFIIAHSSKELIAKTLEIAIMDTVPMYAILEANSNSPSSPKSSMSHSGHFSGSPLLLFRKTSSGCGSGTASPVGSSPRVLNKKVPYLSMSPSSSSFNNDYGAYSHNQFTQFLASPTPKRTNPSQFSQSFSSKSCTDDAAIFPRSQSDDFINSKLQHSLNSRSPRGRSDDFSRLTIENKSMPTFNKIADSPEFKRTSLMHNNNNIKVKSSTVGSQWRCLGKVLVSRDPATVQWNPRVLFVCDNYIFECLPESLKIIGFLCLCEATVTVSTFVKEDTRVLDHAVKVVYYPKGTREVAQDSMWFRCVSFEDLNVLSEEFLCMSRLQLTNIFKVANGAGATLGHGIYNEILLGKRLHSDYDIASGSPSQHISPATSNGSSIDDSDTEALLSAGFMDNGYLNYASANNLRQVVTEESCALKIVNKESFFQRVHAGKERADSIVREVLAQLVVSLKGRWLNFKTMKHISALKASAACIAKHGVPIAKLGSQLGSPISPPAVPQNNIFRDSLDEKMFGYRNVPDIPGYVPGNAPGYVPGNAPGYVPGSCKRDSVLPDEVENYDDYISYLSSVPIVQIYSAFETLDQFVLELELMQSRDLFDKMSAEGSPTLTPTPTSHTPTYKLTPIPTPTLTPTPTPLPYPYF